MRDVRKLKTGLGRYAKGTQGRVYGGDPSLTHVPDGKRGEIGREVAAYLGMQMRRAAINSGANSNSVEDWSKPLCPGCYMVVLFNAAVTLAKESGQSFSELGRTMSEAFAKLATCPDDDPACIEEIAVKLDNGGAL